ncbi:MAG: M81 family metallopeptidase [Gemmatimonadetes bacterium]|jgi:microcystin degradation protein MlrC|nr:M81 family metallopeptidase [Gemmatimonadota bacterium]
MRVGIVSLMHESNSFISTPTTLDMFKASRFLRGADVGEFFSNGLNEIAGFLDGLDGSGIEAVPMFYAGTAPSGEITEDTCDALIDAMFEEIERAGPVDGFLAAPHGANVGATDEYHDLDGHWLTRLRTQIGPDLPIVCTLDPHTNLSKRMLDACNATIAYRSNPHLDQKAVGTAAAELMVKTLRGEIKPTQAAAFPPIAINIERQRTTTPPCLPLYELADGMLAKPGILSNSIILGFPYSDVAEMGSATIVVTDNDPGMAQELADDLAGYLLDHRDEFVGEFIDIGSAIDRAMGIDGPVCLLDMGDNVGGGSAADGTLIAADLHRRANTRSFVCLFDADSVTKAVAAGIGAELVLEMGGKTDALHGPPLEAKVRVRSIHDGRFRESEIRHGGQTEFDMGTTAVVRTETGLTISLTTRRTVPVSLGVMTSIGLDPADFDIIIAKGVHSPVAAYDPVCTELIRVDTAGATTADMRNFDYKHRRKPMYPFEKI